MSSKHGLGRGLDALLGGKQEQKTPASSSDIQKLPLERITPNRFQPRLNFSDESLEDLCNSIKAQGVLQPILVREISDGKFEIVAGERRFRASKMAGLTDIPAMVKEISDSDSLAIALIENLQREDLNPVEEALGYKRLLDEFEINQEGLAKMVGKSRSAVTNSLRLLVLPKDMLDEIEKGVISPGHGRALLAVADEDARKRLFSKVVTKRLTVRQTEQEAVFWKENNRLMDDKSKKTDGLDSQDQHQDLEMIKSAQASLSDKLNAKVVINHKKNSGKIIIGYKNKEQLEDLLQLMNSL